MPRTLAVAALALAALAAAGPADAAVGSWTLLGPTGSPAVSALVHATGSPTLYAATALPGHQLWRSSDDGASWAAADTGLPSLGPVVPLASDPTSDQTLYAGTNAKGVWKTTSGGGSWTAANTGITGDDVTALALDPAAPLTLYEAAASGGVAQTTDGAATAWSGHPLGGQPATAIAVAPSQHATVYAVEKTSHQLWRSLDGGTSWAMTGLAAAAADATGLVVDPSDPTRLYVVEPGGIETSADAGTTLHATGTLTGTPWALVVDPNDPSRVWAATGSGVWLSANRGASWTSAGPGLPAGGATSLAVDAASTNLWAGTAAGVYGLRLSADLTSAVARDPGEVGAGQPVVFWVTVHNGGPDTATGVTLTDITPGAAATTAVVPSQGTCSGLGTLTCALGTLRVGASATVQITTLPFADGAIADTSIVSASQYDANSTNDGGRAYALRDATPPGSLSMTRPVAPLQAADSFPVGWTATDATNGTVRYDVRERRDDAGGAYRSWLTGTSLVGARFSGPPGSTYCFSVRATDGVGNATGYSPDHCTGLPYPAGLLARHGHWRRSRAHGVTALVARGAGARLSHKVRTMRIALVVTRCPGCGTVQVSFSGTPVRTIATASRRLSTTSLVLVRTFGRPRSGVVEIRTLDDRPVRVEALAVSDV